MRSVQGDVEQALGMLIEEKFLINVMNILQKIFSISQLYLSHS